mmetsp:Transcript_22724/g.73084  ORF Transcript_22724/g.73084 Transcript_22724/m.73084 type:complete len:219 (+) Transcript_22724:494-1150(+)
MPFATSTPFSVRQARRTGHRDVKSSSPRSPRRATAAISTSRPYHVARRHARLRDAWATSSSSMALPPIVVDGCGLLRLKGFTTCTNRGNNAGYPTRASRIDGSITYAASGNDSTNALPPEGGCGGKAGGGCGGGCQVVSVVVERSLLLRRSPEEAAAAAEEEATSIQAFSSLAAALSSSTAVALSSSTRRGCDSIASGNNDDDESEDDDEELAKPSMS